MWFYLEKQFVGKRVSCPAFYENEQEGRTLNSVQKSVKTFFFSGLYRELKTNELEQTLQHIAIFSAF